MMSAMPVIDSRHNTTLKAALALREREARLAQGQTLVDGAREALRVLDAGTTVARAFVCRGLIRSDDAERVLRQLGERGAEVVQVSERAHDRLAYGNRRDGIVLVVDVPPHALDDLDIPPDPLVLVTEDVEKPGNLGAILRTADGAGCAAVLAIGGTDLFNPNVVRASVGTIFTVPVAATTADQAIAWLRRRRIRAVAAVVGAATSYFDADLSGSVALILGSEADGLSAAWHDSQIEAVSIPMAGTADSLNVSVAAAILAYESRRQREATER